MSIGVAALMITGCTTNTPNTETVNEEVVNEETVNNEIIDNDIIDEYIISETEQDIIAIKERYLGLTVAEALAQAEASDTLFRVVEQDGQPLPATMDYRPGRINAIVINDILIDLTIEGINDTTEETPITNKEVNTTTDHHTTNPSDDMLRNIPPINEADYDFLMGLTEAEALAQAEANNIPARVVARDDQLFPVTSDLQHGRANLTITDGIVTKVDVESIAIE
jgi:hypothetical protein